MNYLLAKIAIRGNDNIKKVLTDRDNPIFQDFQVAREVEYNDEYKLQDEEWFSIEDFSSKNYCPEWIKSVFNPANYFQLRSNEYSKVQYFISVQSDNNAFHFQRILNNGKILNKKLLTLSAQPQIVEHDTLLMINSEPDALYEKNSDKLLFRDLSRIRPMFLGIDILYREATDAEVRRFLSLDRIELKNGFNSDMVKVPNRRRINTALQQYSSFTYEQQQNILDYISEFRPEILNDDRNGFIIESDESLKHFIYAIDQRYYSTPVTGQKRVATSVESI